MELIETNKSLELPKITSDRLVKQGLKSYRTPDCCFSKLTVPSVDHYNSLYNYMMTRIFPMTLSCSGQSVAAMSMKLNCTGKEHAVCSTLSLFYAEHGKMQSEQGERLQKEKDCLMVKAAKHSPPKKCIVSNYRIPM